MSTEVEEEDDLRKEVVKQIAVSLIMVAAVVVAAYLERQASSPDIEPPLVAKWRRDWRNRRLAEQEWRTSWSRLRFEVHCLLPGAFTDA